LECFVSVERAHQRLERRSAFRQLFTYRKCLPRKREIVPLSIAGGVCDQNKPIRERNHLAVSNSSTAEMTHDRDMGLVDVVLRSDDGWSTSVLRTVILDFWKMLRVLSTSGAAIFGNLLTGSSRQ
jgi:hypothetical protein